MNHLPYEEWLLSGETLLPEQQAALQGHLDSCEACRFLADGWEGVERLLCQAPMVAPAAGFTDRWQARLAVQKQKQQRRQNLLILLYIAGGLGVLLISLGLLIAPLVGSSSTFFWAWVYRMVSFFTLAYTTQDSLITLLRTLFDVVPLPVWIFAIGMLSELAVLWLVALRLIVQPKRMVA